MGDSDGMGGECREKRQWTGVVEGCEAKLVVGAKEVGSEGTMRCGMYSTSNRRDSHEW
jgi:hypothetical protein